MLVKLIEEYDKVWTSDWGEGWFLVDTPVGIITAFPCLENLGQYLSQWSMTRSCIILHESISSACSMP